MDENGLDGQGASPSRVRRTSLNIYRYTRSHPQTLTAVNAVLSDRRIYCFRSIEAPTLARGG
jgi:hypothetical protein